MLPDFEHPQYIWPRGNATWTATLHHGMVAEYSETNSSEALESTTAIADAIKTWSDLLKHTDKNNKSMFDADTEKPAPPKGTTLFAIETDCAGCLRLERVPDDCTTKLLNDIGRLPRYERLP